MGSGDSSVKCRCNMKNTVFFCSVLLAAAVNASAVVDNVKVELSLPNSIEVSYDLKGTEPAVITLAASTNGVAVCESRLVSLSGDVCRKIEPGVNKKIHWAIGKDWPGANFDAGVVVTVQAWPLSSPPPYMAVDLTIKSNLFFYTSAKSVYGGVTNQMYKKSMMLMRRIPAAEIQWRMGAPSSETDPSANATENPHLVTLSSDYYMSVFELTQYQWKLFNSTKGFHFKGSDMLPAESFSWTNIRGRRTDGYNWPDNGHAVASDSILGKMRNVTGLEFDLPTEAQWEYACRAGSAAAFANDRSDIGNLGWYNITNATVEVGLKDSNEWGLYDMHGNVHEMCLDWYQAELTGPVRDPAGVSFSADTSYSSNTFVIRGGSYNSFANDCRSARRRNFTSAEYHRSFGCRLVCPVAVWQAQ